MCSPNQQPSLGGCARQRSLLRAFDVTTKGFRRQRAQIVALDKALLTDRVGKLPRNKLALLLAGIDVVLGR